MVLMGDGRAEQGEDTVAGRLHHISVVPLDRFDHQLQGWIDDRASLFGVEVSHQLGRALDIREQRRDRFTLTITGCRCARLIRPESNPGSG